MATIALSHSPDPSLPGRSSFDPSTIQRGYGNVSSPKTVGQCRRRRYGVFVSMLGQDSELSAFCSTPGTSRVNGAEFAARRPTITVRLTVSEKERFGTLAATHGISESALALIAIRGLLNLNTPASSAKSAPREPASDRITIRLRPGDGQVIVDRAAKRGIKASKYLAALVRGHVARDPPLTTDELVALKTAISVLSKNRDGAWNDPAFDRHCYPRFSNADSRTSSDPGRGRGCRTASPRSNPSSID